MSPHSLAVTSHLQEPQVWLSLLHPFSLMARVFPPPEHLLDFVSVALQWNETVGRALSEGFSAFAVFSSNKCSVSRSHESPPVPPECWRILIPARSGCVESTKAGKRAYSFDVVIVNVPTNGN